MNRSPHGNRNERDEKYYQYPLLYQHDGITACECVDEIRLHLDAGHRLARAEWRGKEIVKAGRVRADENDLVAEKRWVDLVSQYAIIRRDRIAASGTSIIDIIRGD